MDFFFKAEKTFRHLDQSAGHFAKLHSIFTLQYVIKILQSLSKETLCGGAKRQFYTIKCESLKVRSRFK